MPNYRIISSDNHVFEPPDLWAGRGETKFKDRLPEVVRHDDGTDWWYCDGLKLLSIAFGTQVGRRFEESERYNMSDTFENVRLGGYVPEEHVKDLDVDGVDTSIIYPTLGLLLFSAIKDGELLSSIFRTYNDWLAEFCKSFPKRLKGIAMVNVDDVVDGVNELQRCANMGFAGAMITVYPPEGRTFNSPAYESLWAAAQDLDMPLSLHINTNRPGPGQEFSDLDTMRPSFFSNVDHWVRMSIGDMIFSGVFERYPKLQIGAVEMELSWVPHFLDRIDYTYTERPEQVDRWYRFKEDMLPSDYFHRNVFLSFQEDGLGIQLRDIIGIDNLQWASDYPHIESTFPRSQQILEEILRDCTEEEKSKIAGGNAARIYKLD